MGSWARYMQGPEELELSRLGILRKDMRASVLARLGLRPGMRVLEVGCGTGEFIRYLGQGVCGVEFYGLDLDSELLTAGEKKLVDTQNTYFFMQGDALQLPWEENYFDVILSQAFLTNIVDYPTALEEMLRVTRPGGVLGTLNNASADGEQGTWGRYPQGADFYGELQKLEEELERRKWEAEPYTKYVAGCDGRFLPQVLAQAGLEDISVLPWGCFTSLSDGSWDRETRRRYIELEYAAALRRRESYSFRTEAERVNYEELVAARRDFRLKNIDDNAVWAWKGGLALLLTGRVPQQKKKPACREERSFWRSRTQEKAAEFSLLVPPGSVPGAETVELRSAQQIRVTAVGSTRSEAIIEAYKKYLARAGQEAGPANGNKAMLTPAELEEYGGTLLRGCVAEIQTAEGILAGAQQGPADYLQKWLFLGSEGRLPASGFRSLWGKEEYFLPDFLVGSYFGPVGLGAGRSSEEACLEGCYDYLARAVRQLLVLGQLTPPPLEVAVTQEETRCLLQRLRQEGVEVRLLDASCGRGLPAVAALLLQGGKTFVGFGAHSERQEAVRRALLEAVAIRYRWSGRQPVFSRKQDLFVKTAANRLSLLTRGVGYYGSRFIAGTPSYAPMEESVWERLQQGGAPARLSSLGELLPSEGFVRIENNKGFSTVRVLLPGLGMLYNFGRRNYLLQQSAAVGTAGAEENAEELGMQYLLAFLRQGREREALEFLPFYMGSSVELYILTELLTLPEVKRAEAAGDLARVFGAEALARARELGKGCKL